jgi:hypothetical protein
MNAIESSCAAMIQEITQGEAVDKKFDAEQIPTGSNETDHSDDQVPPQVIPSQPVLTHAPQTASAQHAAPAKAPTRATKKPLLDPSKYRKAKAPASDDSFSEATQSTIPVRKPGSRNFFRVHPDEEYRLYHVPVVEDDKHELHILSDELEIPEDLERFVTRVNLLTAITHKSTVFLWWFKNSTNDWSKSASRVARRSVTEWVRLSADMDANGYRVETAPSSLRETQPVWPSMTFAEILNTAFEANCIDTLDHPVIRSLQGLTYGS